MAFECLGKGVCPGCSTCDPFRPMPVNDSEELGRKALRDGFRSLPQDANYPDAVLGAGAELCHAISHISDPHMRLGIAMTIMNGIDEAAAKPCTEHEEGHDGGN